MEKYGGKTYSPIKKPETANYQERIDMGKRFLPNRCKRAKRFTISTKDTMKRTAVYVKDTQQQDIRTWNTF